MGKRGRKRSKGDVGLMYYSDFLKSLLQNVSLSVSSIKESNFLIIILVVIINLTLTLQSEQFAI